MTKRDKGRNNNIKNQMRKYLSVRVQTAGALLISGVIIWLLSMIASEALYPGYSIKTNYISDLGVGPWPSDILFNLSIIIFGIFVFLAALILIHKNSKMPFLYCMAIAGAGAFFVGVFPENTGILHYISAGSTFIFGSVAAIEAGRWLKSPYRCIPVIMGITSLLSLIILITKSYGALGPGGIERLIAYPLALFLISYGGYLINEADATQE